MDHPQYTKVPRRRSLPRQPVVNKMASKVSVVVSAWKQFDFLGLQKELDSEAIALAQRQDESETSRRRLVEQSREFKKSITEEIRTAVAPLLKSFQNEVDSLSKRSKAAEMAFLFVYKRLSDVTDPVPWLEMIPSLQQKLSKMQDFEAERKQLKETLAEYEEEFSQVRNQDVTVKQLREKLRQAEENTDETVEARLADFQLQFRKQFEERERELAELQKLTEKKLMEAETKVASMQMLVNELQSELFETRSRLDEATHARSKEVELLLSDLERANQRAALAEKEVTAFQEQLQQVSPGQGQGATTAPGQLVTQGRGHNQERDVHTPPAANMDTPLDMLARPSLQLELAAKEKEVQNLLEDVQRLQTSLAQLRESSARQLSLLEEQLGARTRHIQRLEAQLEEQKNYQEIKRELSILKSIEFPGLAGVEGSPNKPLEVLLLERNKALQSENANLKLNNADLQGRLDTLASENMIMLNSLSAQKELVSQLEHDLANVNTLSSHYRTEGEGQAAATEWVAEAVKDIGIAASPTLQTSYSDADTAATLLPILQAQRERFRARNQELEAQLLEHQQRLALSQSEVERFRADNVALYEKVRFLQSYSGQRSNAGALTSTAAESRYEMQYEERLDPFTTFSRRERQRKIQQLGPFEKIIYSLSQAVVSNKIVRTGAVVYFMLLHALVFLVLYRLAYTESCHRDMTAECFQKFDEHMEKAHGVKFHT